MTLEEMKKQRDKLNSEIKKAEERELMLRQSEVSDRINLIPDEEKRIIFKYMRHDRTSCDDKHPYNGYGSSDNHWRCRKCMLMEILNGEHEGRFDFSISADIWEV